MSSSSPGDCSGSGSVIVVSGDEMGVGDAESCDFDEYVVVVCSRDDDPSMAVYTVAQRGSFHGRLDLVQCWVLNPM